MALLRRILGWQYAFPMRLPVHHFSRTTNLKSNLDVHVESGVANIKMGRAPVNGLNLEFLTEFAITLDKLHVEGCRGMILSSKLPKIFSAGLDITEMYQPDKARLQEFWRMLQEVFIKLYGSQMVTIAAINGHAPAGGCLLSLLCDYRIMADGKFTIGLNETQLGIVAPFWFGDAMINTIGHRETEKALQLGKLYSPQQAQTIRLVDDVVPADALLTTAAEEIKAWLKIPDHARQLTKLQCRQQTLDRLTGRREEDIENFVKFIMKESIQRSIGMYLDALKAKSQNVK